VGESSEVTATIIDLLVVVLKTSSIGVAAVAKRIVSTFITGGAA
jgi:hypothetical protein